MAVYSFAEGLYEGRPLRFYNSTTPTRRDFTFISDAVSGVLLALDHVPSQCGEVFNVGSASSVELIRVLRLLERELNAIAKIVSVFVCVCMYVCVCVIVLLDI